MKRVLAVWSLALLLLVGWGRPAWGHNLALFGHVSHDRQGELVVRLVDPYGARVEGQRVIAYAAAPGGRQGKPVELREGPAGTYRGVVAADGAETYAVTIDLELAGDLHRIRYEMTAGQSQPEQMIPMAQIDPPRGLPWNRILYIAAALLLLAATAVALVRRKPGGQAPFGPDDPTGEALR